MQAKNWRIKKLVVGVLLASFFVVAVFISASFVFAGSLSPLAPPNPTSYTLSDIFTRLVTNDTATAGNHAFAPVGAPAGSLYTLTQIYDAIPTIDGARLFASTTYLGVEGTLNLACNTATFNGVANLVANTYDGAGNGANRWCMGTSTNPAGAGNILSGYSAWVNGQEVAGSITVKTGDTVVASSSAQGTSLFLTVPAGYYNGASTTTVSTSSASFIAGNIKSGVTVFGLAGTLPAYTYGDASSSYVLVSATASGTALANLYNGSLTGGSYPGGSQALGGVDDYNNAQTPNSLRYVGPAGWTQCNSSAYNATTNPGGNYCNTGVAGADAKDNSTNLVWSMPCNGAGCDSFSDAAPSTAYTWAASTTNAFNYSTAQSGTVDAQGLCTSGDHVQAGWSLPHQKQLMQAYIDGSYGNLESSGIYRYYWSATTVSVNPASAWFTSLSFGGTNTYTKVSYQYYVRCVRSVP
jgi:hypothetical protein